MRRLVLLFGMAMVLFWNPQSGRAQAGIELAEVSVQYDFGVHLTFQARAQSQIPIISGNLYFRDDFDDITRVQPLQFAEAGFVSSRYDVIENVLRPFVNITYWFEFTMQDGQSVRSADYHSRYLDNRFTWKETSNETLRVYWYEGDDAFGQALLDTASRGWNQAATLVPSGMITPVEIYIYATASDLQGALYLGGETWVGGHANPKLGVVMAVVTPGSERGMEKDTILPHELTHVLLYRSVGENYAYLPTWLVEGIASLAELYSTPDYEIRLDFASQEGTLIKMADLCAAFPTEPDQAYLAYAQSQSFVRYLRETYGNIALYELITVYSDGVSCEEGALRTLGVPLIQLEMRWRESVLGEHPAGVFYRNMLPYFIVLSVLLLLPLIGMIQGRKQDDTTK